MPRIPYLPQDIQEPSELVASIRDRRGGVLLNLDLILLYSPPFARGWNSLLREVRTNLILPARLRELAICCVALLNETDYEFHIHAPEFLKSGGTESQIEALRNIAGAGENLGQFGDAERAVIRLALEMTRGVRIAEETMAAVMACLPDPRQVVELVGVIATYNMVSRFLTALAIGPE